MITEAMRRNSRCHCGDCDSDAAAVFVYCENGVPVGYCRKAWKIKQAKLAEKRVLDDLLKGLRVAGVIT